MRTKLAEELGLEFPIFAFTHCRDVAAAVSKAGGLGVLGVAGHSPKTLEQELLWIENEIGDKPYGVDLLLPTKFVGSDPGGLDASQLDALKRSLRSAPRSGKREEYPAVAGQISGMVHDILPVREIVAGILTDATALAARLGALALEAEREN